jgi:hypothetical protein
MKISGRNFCYGLWFIGWLFILLGSGFRFYESILAPLGVGIWLILFCGVVFRFFLSSKPLTYDELIDRAVDMHLSYF